MLDLNRDRVLAEAERCLNARYGKGEVYKIHDERFFDTIIVHRTETDERRFRENIQTRDFELREHIVLPTPDIFFEHRSPGVYATERTLDEFDPRYIPEPIAPKAREKKKKWNGSIKNILQKEINGWLKSVSLEAD